MKHTETDIDDAATIETVAQSPRVSQSAIFRVFSSGRQVDLYAAAGLALIALVPRVILARQLDLVTDEPVYITGGKLYLSLIKHASIGNSAWLYNYEHPPFVKLLIGLAVALKAVSGHLLPELLAARIPSIVAGTLLIVVVYWLGRAPFGRVAALAATLCLAVSPWLAYFSALAYLDMTMTTLITMAYLLLWHALQKPRLYLLIAALSGLAIGSKYTAILLLPGMIAFSVYYFVVVQPRLDTMQRRSLPIAWWLGAIVLLPLVFLAVDPAIWPQPVHLLYHSLQFEWDHSAHGHLTFIAGRSGLHVPVWTAIYTLLVKFSVFVTFPAACFVGIAMYQLVRFHRPGSSLAPQEATRDAFLLIWLLGSLGMFSLLDIAVGTHYFLPVAPPVALAAARSWLKILRYRRGMLFDVYKRRTIVTGNEGENSLAAVKQYRSRDYRALLAVFALAALALPHLIGLVTVYASEGYTSELFHGENTTLQVAYPGYREAVEWLAAHSHGQASIGLVALSNTLENSGSAASWFHYNSNLAGRFKLTEVQPDDYNLPYDYLVWPMHLPQRGYAIPEQWRGHIVHIISGGNTIYCYILARNPATVFQ
jgi:hypothetical protein